MPPGGDGFYYFSAYFAVNYYKFARFVIEINGLLLCTAYTDQQEVGDEGQAACSAATYATQGFEPHAVNSMSHLSLYGSYS